MNGTGVLMSVKDFETMPEHTQWLLRALIPADNYSLGQQADDAGRGAGTISPVRATKHWLKRIARVPWLFARPLVRPFAWRLRGFLIQPMLAELEHSRQEMMGLLQQVTILHHTTAATRELIESKLREIAEEQYLAKCRRDKSEKTLDVIVALLSKGKRAE
jgi:hypothetical protein